MVKILLVKNKNYELIEVDTKDMIQYKWDRYKIVDLVNLCEIYVLYLGGEYKNELCSMAVKNMMFGDIAFVKMNSVKMIDISINDVPELEEAYNSITMDDITNINLFNLNISDTSIKESEADCFNKIAMR